MRELKTLEEIEFPYDYMNGDKIVVSEELKQEAKRWRIHYKEWIENHDMDIEESYGAIDFINDFFDLEDEE